MTERFDLPIDTNKLGCIMLEFDPLPVMQWTVEAGLGGTFVYGNPDEQPWVQGPVAEKGSHATLLYGLVSRVSCNPFGRDREAGHEYRQYIDPMLEDLDLVGGHFYINELEVFGNNPAYDVVVGRIESTVLNEANRRLRLLPHVDTFVDYKPHVTLAYVQKGTGRGFADAIWNNVMFEADLIGKAINYGGEKII